MNRIKKCLEKMWYRAGVEVSSRLMGTGTDRDRIWGATFTLAVAAGAFALTILQDSQAFAVTDLNGAASNLQSGFQSAGRALYYGAGAGGIVTTAGGILHAKTAHANKQTILPGLSAAGAGAALTGIGTYMAFFNQTTMQDTGGMSTNAMGIPQ